MRDSLHEIILRLWSHILNSLLKKRRTRTHKIQQSVVNCVRVHVLHGIQIKCEWIAVSRFNLVQAFFFQLVQLTHFETFHFCYNCSESIFFPIENKNKFSKFLVKITTIPFFHLTHSTSVFYVSKIMMFVNTWTIYTSRNSPLAKSEMCVHGPDRE